jgi:hypothetical protein
MFPNTAYPNSPQLNRFASGLRRAIFAVSACLASALGGVQAHDSRVVNHQVVFRESDRFGGWPANNGSWSWGDELLVGFTVAWHQVQDVQRHQMDRSRPKESWLARSRDGGISWSIEKPKTLLVADEAVLQRKPLSEPIDFTAPGFAFTLRFHKSGPAYFYYSNDRGHNWAGPFDFPALGTPGIRARTDYLVRGPKELTVFLTATKENGDEGRPFCARTKDGGLTWEFMSYIGPEPKTFTIMPATLALDENTFLTTVRAQESEMRNWIDAWISRDNGLNWEYYGRPVPDTGTNNGNPPDMLRLRDGRLCLVYGYRAEPRGIRARLSNDNGRTWGEEIVLRADAVTHDLGYSRSFQRSDGNIVSVYYFNDGPHTERFIAATTWSPDPR